MSPKFGLRPHARHSGSKAFLQITYCFVLCYRCISFIVNESFVMLSRMWRVFNLDELKSKVAGKDPCIHEFLRSSQMSCAIYRLPVGAKDMQAPHLEDELYFVVEGRARLRVDEDEHDVGPGMMLFVSATTEHSFFDITEDLTLVAMFGPSEGIKF